MAIPTCSHYSRHILAWSDCSLCWCLEGAYFLAPSGAMVRQSFEQLKAEEEELQKTVCWIGTTTATRCPKLWEWGIRSAVASNSGWSCTAARGIAWHPWILWSKNSGHDQSIGGAGAHHKHGGGTCRLPQRLAVVPRGQGRRPTQPTCVENHEHFRIIQCAMHSARIC